MKTSRARIALFAVALVASVASPAVTTLSAPAPRAEGRTFERAFRLDAPGELVVDSHSGSVDVRTADGDAVAVRATIKRNVSWGGAGVGDDEIARLRANPPVRQEGNTVRIDERGYEDLLRRVSVDYEIVVPRSAKISVTTHSGAVTLAGPRAGATVETHSGAVRVEAASGAVALRTSSGAVRLAGAPETVSVATGSGSIEVAVEAARSVDAESRSGSVTVSGVKGALRAETGSGAIRLEGSPDGDWNVRSRSGSVRIGIPEGAGAVLVARSDSGSVNVSLPTAGGAGESKHWVDTTIGAGGARIDVETRSGSIAVGGV